MKESIRKLDGTELMGKRVRLIDVSITDIFHLFLYVLFLMLVQIFSVQ